MNGISHSQYPGMLYMFLANLELCIFDNIQRKMYNMVSVSDVLVRYPKVMQYLVPVLDRLSMSWSNSLTQRTQSQQSGTVFFWSTELCLLWQYHSSIKEVQNSWKQEKIEKKERWGRGQRKKLLSWQWASSWLSYLWNHKILGRKIKFVIPLTGFKRKLANCSVRWNDL